MWVLASTSSISRAQNFGPVPVRVALIREDTIGEEVSFIGTLEPDIATKVGAVVAGRVVESAVREGDRVSGGESILLQLDRTPREIALREAEAAVAKTREEWEKLKRGFRTEEVAQRKAEALEQKALRERARKDFDRAKKLFEDDLISLAEFQRVESDYVAAREKHERANAALRLATSGARVEDIAKAEAEYREMRARADLIAFELSRTTLTAPISGYVVRKHVEVGDWVNPGDVVADLVDLDPVFATGPVGERKIRLLRRGLPATVRLDAFPGETFSGEVAYIIPQADVQSRTFPVKVLLSNPKGRLKAGLLARITIEIEGEKPSLLVPKDALVRKGANEVVFVIENDRAREYEVQTGRAFKEHIEVTNDALRAGLQVVVLGNELLRDGAPVKIVELSAQNGDTG